MVTDACIPVGLHEYDLRDNSAGRINRLICFSPVMIIKFILPSTAAQLLYKNNYVRSTDHAIMHMPDAVVTFSLNIGFISKMHKLYHSSSYFAGRYTSSIKIKVLLQTISKIG